MAFSPDGGFLYVCDSRRRVVLSFEVDRENGDLGSPIALIEVEPGVPDGMAVAVDGSLWVAHAQTGFIRRYTAQGRIIETFSVPDASVTSLCFGGDESRQVFVTSGSHHPGEVAGVYEAVADVVGVEVPLARVMTER
jgi:sugar lactone lactonase YvrE